MIRPYAFILFIFFLTVYSCKKESFIQSADAVISFSSDTLFFDTVFTAIGSVTATVKIMNENDQKLKLSSIRLAGGATSPFKININGMPSTEVTNEVLKANDSIYLFVQVYVNPDDRTQPFILEDSVEVQYNGRSKWIQLRAYGQNAIFLKDKVIERDTTWNNYLPIVITGLLRVDTGVSLKVEEGTRIYIHATAPVIVNGTLDATGTFSEPVIFTGDRTDAEYKDLPASWPGIYFTASSKNNSLKNVILKNAYQGIIAEQMADDGNPKVILSQSRIENIYDAGILALNSSVFADNSLIANCGSNIAVMLGGQYSFVNCTIASFGSFYISHKDPVLQAVDYFERSGIVYTSDLKMEFTNCILWGDNGTVGNEIFLEKKGNGLFNVLLDHSLYKAKDAISLANFVNSQLNEPPLFDSINASKNYYDFHISDLGSPAIKSGKNVPYLYDLEGKERVNPPDMGCYEN